MSSSLPIVAVVPSELQEPLFYCGETKCWHRLTRKVTESPYLEIFKTHLDKIMVNLFYVTVLELQGQTS